AHHQGCAGPHRLSAFGEKPDSSGRARAGRTGGRRMGPRQRFLPAHHLADEQHPRRHCRRQRDPRHRGGRLQLPLLHRVHARGLAAALARRAGPTWPRLRAAMDRGWPAVLDHARYAGQRGAGRDSGRNWPRDRALHHRRHQRRPLHRQDLPASDRTRPAQRQHPQDRRMRGNRGYRTAQEYLPPRAGNAVRMTIVELIDAGAQQLADAGVSFGHGTNTAFDEAAWLVLWQLGLPLDSPLDGQDSVANQPVALASQAQIATLFRARIDTRQPAAYLTHEAWLQGVPFYVDERAIVPRSLIAELLVEGDIDPWLGPRTLRVLDLCTGNASLAVLAAMAYPEISVDAADISTDALEVARI